MAKKRAKSGGVKKRASRGGRAADTARSLSSKKGWETRRKDPGSAYRTMVKMLSKYAETHDKLNYSRFRAAKRMLFKHHPGVAQAMAADAGRDSGWEEAFSVKFARMS